MSSPDTDRFYKSKTLWRAFGILSAVMLVFTLWMILDDYGQEWKGYQREFLSLKKQKYEALKKEAEGAVDATKLAELKAGREKAEGDLNAKKAEVAKLAKDLDQLNTKLKNATAKYQGEKAVWDVRKYEWEAKFGHYYAEGHEVNEAKAKAALEKLNKHWSQVLALRNQMNLLAQQQGALQKEYDGLFAEKTKIEKEWKVLHAEVDKLEGARASAEFTLTKLVRSAPILDMANPVFRLQQIVLPHITDDITFAQVRRVDRCTSCHLAIDTPGFENEKNPFKTHPRLDLMLGSRSPHPIDTIGCTACHEGRGQASHFVRSAHTPRNEEQKKDWQKKYGWHEMHHVIEKMLPLQYTEGKCKTCHKQTEYVPRAQKLNASIQLIKSAGCYGCHRIEGWDHIRKPAPSLKKIKGKVTRDWIVKWIRDPKSFNEYARMPAAFHQSNIKTEEHHAFNEAEIFALADFLLAESEEYQPNYSSGLGSAARGKDLFGSIGCLGCHQVDDFGRERGRFVQAPDLSSVGSKVSARWLATWLKNPRHYWAETTMPSLRLTDGEIADLSAYLLSKKNPEFEKLDTGKTDLETQAKVLKLYLMRDPKMAPATEEKVDQFIASLKPHEVTQSLGTNAVMRYGCFGCHEIKGYEKTPGIGVELTEEGTKPVGKLDFGLLHLEHTNYAWFHKKFENTRAFDEGLVKEYLDLLRMPQYGFDEHERNSLVTSILGLTSQKLQPPAAKQLSPREAKMEEGIRVVHKYNCQGCHVVEKMFESLPDGHPDFDEHEKRRFALEGRILQHYAEDETLGPPPLVTQGKRVHTDWVHGFLEHPEANKLRVRLKVRMPTFDFSLDETNKLLQYWAHYGDVPMPIEPNRQVAMTNEKFAAGKSMFGQLQCMNCHTMGEHVTQEMMEGGSKGLAPDLLLSNRRLRKEWIVELLKDPQKMIPGTRMPGFWPDGVSPFPDILKGDSNAQIDAVADYVLYLGQSKK